MSTTWRTNVECLRLSQVVRPDHPCIAMNRKALNDDHVESEHSFNGVYEAHIDPHTLHHVRVLLTLSASSHMGCCNAQHMGVLIRDTAAVLRLLLSSKSWSLTLDFHLSSTGVPEV